MRIQTGMYDIKETLTRILCMCLIAGLLAPAGMPLQAQAATPAAKPAPILPEWRVEFLPQSHRLRIVTSGVGKPAREVLFPLPDGVNRFTYDADTIYLLGASGKEVLVVSKGDVDGLSGTDDLLPHASLDFSRDLPAPATEIAGVEHGGGLFLFLSTAPANGRADVYPFVIRKGSAPVRLQEGTEENASTDVGSESAAEDNLGRGNTPGIVALKSKPFSVLGGQSLAATRDPESGGVALLSLQRSEEGAVLHEYEASNAFEPAYVRTYILPEKLKDMTTLEAVLSPAGFFKAYDSEMKRAEISLLRIRGLYSLARTEFLNTWTNEVQGNVWTKQLIGWGVLSSMIDDLDEAFGNSKISEEELSGSEDVKALMDRTSPEEVLNWAESTKLFTPDQISKMRIESRVQKGNGRRWFILASAALGMLTMMKVKNGPAAFEAEQIQKRIWSFFIGGLRRLGVSGEGIAKWEARAARFTQGVRARMIRNAEAGKYPSRWLKQLEKKAKEFYEIVKTDKGVEFLKTKKPPNITARVRRVLEAMDDMAQAEATGKAAKIRDSVLKPSGKDAALAERFKISVQALDRQKSISNAKLRFIKARAAIEELKTKGKDAVLPEAGDILSTSNDAMGFLKATGHDFVQAEGRKVINEAIEILDSNPGFSNSAASYLRQFLRSGDKYLDDVSKLMKGKQELAAVMDGWVTKGTVHPFFDYWARVSTAYNKIPGFVYGLGLNKETVKRYIRPDYVATASGTLEQVVVTGETARLALTTGFFDITGDIFVQWLSRRDATDPNERIIGSGDNHFELFSVGDTAYGIHFDLMGRTLDNIWGWTLSMPLSYAKVGMNTGSTGKITQLRRMWDSQIRSVPLIPWGMCHDYPIWWLTSNLISWDYKADHAEDAKKDPEAAEKAYKAFRERIKGRTTTLKSILEQTLFGKAVGVPYVNVQYVAQGEFDRVAPMIFGSSWPSRIVSGLVMPVSSGYWINRWWSDYFGFNNPDMFAIMERLKIDGILKKIDANGYTNPSEWTEHEKNMFFYLISLFELERYSKEKPLSPEASPAEAAAWYEQAYLNLFGGKDVDLTIPDDIRMRIIADPKNSIGKPDQNRYAAEAKKFRQMLESMDRGIARISYNPPKANQDQFAVTIRPYDAAADRARDYAQLISQANEFNGALANTVLMLKEQRGTLDAFHSQTQKIAIMDTLILGYAFFAAPSVAATEAAPAAAAVGRLGAIRKKALSVIERAFTPGINRFLKRAGTSTALAFWPYALWLGDQANAEVGVASNTAQLLSELQSVSFALTEELTLESIRNTYAAGGPLSGDVKDLELMKTVEDSLEKSKGLLENLLIDMKAESEDLLTSRRHRWGKVYDEYFPYFGLGFFGSWIGARYALNQFSAGYITKIADPYAKRFLQASFLAWVFFSQDHAATERKLQLTTTDFFSLYQSYVATLIQLEVLNTIRESRNGGKPVPTDLGAVAAASVKKQKLVQDMESYRGRLMKLLQPVE